ncbi:MAG: 1-acyl-sn-glycerol-3-phosphate acyltransferase [Saprospiraceae bacterium]|nr:1-acyl-sn-glycerol-3-phosphate acyltransferase [Saprospiraceae bacterium]
MNFLRKIWAIYGILIFFLLWLVLFPLYYIAFLVFPRAWVKYIIWFSHHIYTRLFFGLTLVRFKIEGLENIDHRSSYIIVSNHQTALDFMMNARAFPGVYKFLAKHELVKVPVFGFIVRKLCVLVNRSSAASRSSSMKYLHKTLAEGYSVFIYPEGTRNTTPDPLLPFHKGAFRIAIESGKPIAVQTILGVEKISNPKVKGLDMWPGRVRIVWSKPIETAGLTMENVDALSEQVRGVILKNLQNV